MSGGGACQCPAGKDRSTWVVIQRLCNHSAFNGYHRTASAWSSVVCSAARGGCRAIWRTKAGYVGRLPDADDRDLN